MSARVYRGFDRLAAFASVTRFLLAYGGGFFVLWALGLVVRGWQGWALVLAPVVFVVGSRLWAWRRVSVELADGVLRYEGVSTEDDFEVPVDSIRRVYRDSMLDGSPLVLVLQDEDERVVARLRPARATELSAALVACGAEPARPA